MKKSKDHLTPEKRFWNMSRIRGKDIKPEIAVRKALHAVGYWFRLNVKELSGKPDIVLPKYKTVIFINECFWHRHKGCKEAVTPTKNRMFWVKKFKGNVAKALQTTRNLHGAYRNL